MISGDRILRNAVAICEMTKTFWQTGNLKINEDLENPSRTCFARGESFRKKTEIEELEKLDASETYPRRPNAREVFFFFDDPLVANGSAKLSGRDYEFEEPTLRSETTVRGENLTARGKIFDLKNQKMTQKLGKILVCSRKFHLLSSY